jgi:predicted nucleotidyltransferase
MDCLQSVLISMTEISVILKRAGLDLGRIPSSVREIVLFGSRALGCATRTSDWDVLVIAKRDVRLHEVCGLDVLVFVTGEESVWLGSELATHVAAHGLWLHGSGAWRADVDVSRAAAAKVKVLRRDASVLMEYWDKLSPPRALEHLRRFRRDAQRLEVLRRGDGVPPAAWLDADWARSGVRERRRLVISSAGETGLGGPAFSAWTARTTL